ncbi:putative uncharacterized protein [groundwater metagenome]
MSTEFEFFLKADLSKYKGLYVAILDDKVIVSGENAKQVWEDCKRKYPDKTPTLAKIPREEALILVIKWK